MGDSTILGQTLVLLIIFQFKHFLADFPLQCEYMLRKTRTGWSWVAPLGLHCAVHAGLTLLIILAIAPSLWWLMLVDFITHFVMDRVKAAPHYLGRFSDNTRPAYWNCFGFDQMVHHLTGFYIVWELVTVSNH